MEAFATYPFKIDDNGIMVLIGSPQILKVTSRFSLSLYSDRDFEVERDFAKNRTYLKLFYPSFWKDDLLTVECYYKDGLPTENSNIICSNHEFVQYIGFTEIYDYCVRCDKKRF